MQWSSTLAVSMMLGSREVLGVIQLFDARDSSHERTLPFSSRLLVFVEVLPTQAAVALKNQELMKAQIDEVDINLYLH